MKRLICFAAVASALFAATSVPSRADTIDMLGMSSVPGTVYDTTYSFHLPTTETVSISGAEFNIDPFTITGPFSVSFTPPPAFGSASLFNGFETLAAGTYSFLVTGTGGTTSPGNISLYSGFITTSGAISPVPIPGSLALFATGLGLLGVWGWTKKRKTGSGSEAAAC
jgi:hypothetical protein